MAVCGNKSDLQQYFLWDIGRMTGRYCRSCCSGTGWGTSKLLRPAAATSKICFLQSSMKSTLSNRIKENGWNLMTMTWIHLSQRKTWNLKEAINRVKPKAGVNKIRDQSWSWGLNYCRNVIAVGDFLFFRCVAYYLLRNLAMKNPSMMQLSVEVGRCSLAALPYSEYSLSVRLSTSLIIQTRSSLRLPLSSTLQMDTWTSVRGCSCAWRRRCLSQRRR